MTFKSGALLVIPFPFADLSTTKKRPVLAISSPDNHNEFICLSVTSKSYHQTAIPLTNSDMQNGQIPRDSWIRTDKVFTLSASLVIKSLGEIDQQFWKMLSKNSVIKFIPINNTLTYYFTA